MQTFHQVTDKPIIMLKKDDKITPTFIFIKSYGQ